MGGGGEGEGKEEKMDFKRIRGSENCRVHAYSSPALGGELQLELVQKAPLCLKKKEHHHRPKSGTLRNLAKKRKIFRNKETEI